MRSSDALLATLVIGSIVACTADAGQSRCGAGTYEENGECAAYLPCGSGTHARDGACVVDLTCGPGTETLGSSCTSRRIVPGAYQVAVPSPSIEADGHSVIDVVAWGSTPDNLPSTERVGLRLSRATSGSVFPATLALTDVGATASFVPCMAGTSGCLGDATIELFLEADPASVIANRDIRLVQPAPIGSAAPCLGGGNVLYLNGDALSFIHPGIETVTDGTWDIQTKGATDIEWIQLVSSGGTGTVMGFSTTPIGQPIRETVYRRATSLNGMGPAMGVFSGGKGGDVEGEFQILEIQQSSGVLKSLTMTFAQHLRDDTAMLRGCVHVSQ